MLFYDIKDMFFNRRTLVAVAVFLVFAVFLYKYTGRTDENTSGSNTAEEASEGVIIAGISDNENSLYSKLVLGFFIESDIFSKYVDIKKGSDEEMLELIEKGELDVVLIIPEGFVDSLINIENAPVNAYISMSDTTKAMLLNTMFKSYEKYVMAVEANCVALYDVMEVDGFGKKELTRANTEISYKLISTVANKNDYFTDDIVEKFANIPLLVYYAYELIFLLAAYVAMAAGIRMINDRRRGMLARLKSAGVSTFYSVFNKWFLYGTLSAAVTTGVFILRAAAGQIFEIKAVIFATVSAYLLSAVMILLSAVFKTVQSYLLAVNIIILMQMVIGGGIIPLLYLPVKLINIAKFTPNYWFVMRLFSIEENVNPVNMKAVYGVIVFVVAVSILTAGGIYRSKEAHAHEEA